MRVDELEPRVVVPRIIAAPKIRQIYWCEFWSDAIRPEMWKTRPVVVMSYRNKLSGPCLVLPISTKEQDDNKWALRLKFRIDAPVSWVVCNQPATVSPSRLSQIKGKIPLLPQDEFDAVLDLLLDWLPKAGSLT